MVSRNLPNPWFSSLLELKAQLSRGGGPPAALVLGYFDRLVVASRQFVQMTLAPGTSENDISEEVFSFSYIGFE